MRKKQTKKEKQKQTKRIFVDLVFLQQVSRIHESEFPHLCIKKTRFFFFFLESDNPRTVVLSDEFSDKCCSSALYGLYLGNNAVAGKLGNQGERSRVEASQFLS